MRIRQQAYRKFREKSSSVITVNYQRFLAKHEGVKELTDDEKMNKTKQLLIKMNLANQEDHE
jgi:hypothetical protein